MKLRRNKFYHAILMATLTASVTAAHSQQTAQPYQGVVGKTLADSKEWWPQPVKAPQGAPNVIWIVLDDVGFGATGTFGGLINTPVFDSLAANGLKYTNFHTAAICAPTRAAALTGRNHHSVHEGGFSHTVLSAGFPGYDGRIPSKDGTIAEILRENGYNTFAVGKYGLTPDEEASDAGPFDRWPTGKGFEHYFGFLGSEDDNYKTNLVEDNSHIKPDGRHFSEQLTDKAISYIEKQKKAAPSKPFFLYYAPGATHAPHQVDTSWSNLYKGKFDQGWDAFRQQVFDRQKKLGVIPANAVLPERNPKIPAWNSLTAEQKKLYARFFEVYAGYLTYTDYQVGRVVNYLKQINQLNNTLIFVLIGDNGASKEGTQFGAIRGRGTSFASGGVTAQKYLELNENGIEQIGTPESFVNYPLGWAQAANTPFRFWKMDAQSEGGTRNPLIVFYPNGIKDKGGIRTQYGYVTDLLPTTLEFAGIKAPEYIREIKQDTIQGTSLVYSVNDAKAPSRHTQQYYYIFGSRSIYKDGWKAAAAHHPDILDLNKFAGEAKDSIAKNYDNDVWELYNLNEDPTERVDLAKKYPEKVKELQALFDADAKKYNIYPFIDWEDVFSRRIHNNGNATGLK
ncbi:sulfatase-like hydrolase/transferase [Pinibacter aurantiacus]|nr:sulfatase-like hydrolase/transferase [Pinibacter aurantiacus]